MTSTSHSWDEQLRASQKPELDRIDGSSTRLDDLLDEVDRRIAAAIEPYLDQSPIPSLEQVAPALASEKEILLDERDELQAALARAHQRRCTSGPRSSSTPRSHRSPLATSNRRLLVVGFVGGVFAGLLAVVVIARLSPTVLSDDQAEEILGRPVAGTFPSLPGLATTAVRSWVT